MPTKIQINSLQALERLIGGDSETEIEIRNSVVIEFTKKHLKAIAEGGVAKRAADEIIKEAREISRSVATEVLSSGWCAPELSKEWKLAIKEVAANEVRGLIDQAISRSIAECVEAQRPGFQARAESAVERITKYHIEEEVAKRVRAIVAEAQKSFGMKP